MNPAVFPVLWICFCVFVLVLCGFASTTKSEKYIKLLPTKELSWAFTAGFAVFVIAQPFLIFPDLLGGSSETLSQVLNLSLAVVGLVITTSTGIAVATSWRALDNAKDADAHATEALLEYQNIRRDLDRKILSQSAYLEALNARFQYMHDPDCLEFRVAEGYCDALLAPSETAKVRTIEAINDVPNYADIAEKIFRFKNQENFLHRYFLEVSEDRQISRHIRAKFSTLVS